MPNELEKALKGQSMWLHIIFIYFWVHPYFLDEYHQFIKKVYLTLG
jgi:hypothetical protein